MDTSDSMVCGSCGAVVASERAHEVWHDRLAAVEVLAGAAMEVADEAQETADEAAYALTRHGDVRPRVRLRQA